MAGPPPLRLKDLLELDCDSCSAAGFRCYPRRLGESAPAMRRLLDSPSPSLRRHPTSKLSSSLSRTLSRRLGLFWRRRDEDDGEDDAAPNVCSGSESGASSSPTPTTSDDSYGRRGSRCESDSDFSTATISSTSDSMDASNGDEHEAMKRGSTSSGSEADDKEEQLSPVAVMDFPFDDEEGEDAGACSPSPSFSLARLQRRKMLRTQHKIRRFESTEDLGPMDLETLLAATSDDANDLADDVPEQPVTQRSTEDKSRSHRGDGVHHEPDEHDGLLALLMDAGMDHVTKRLLLDFFVEMKRRRRGSMEHYWGELSSAPAGLLLPQEAERLGDGDVLAAVRGWLDGTGSTERWGLNDVLRGGRAVVAEMERDRRWMEVGEEEQEIGVVVAGVLVDQLVDEVVWDLLV